MSRERLHAAQEALKAALRAGSDTSQHRAAIARLEAELSDAAKADAAERQTKQAQSEAALVAAAERITEESRVRVAAMFDSLTLGELP